MKKVLVAVLVVSFLSALLTSCTGSRNAAGRGCPTTNPRYFKG